jgi:HEAT repeat protein
MIVSNVLTIALVVISSALLLLTVAVASGHAVRIWRGRRTSRLEQQYAPFVIRLANEEETDEEAMRRLVDLEPRQWVAARPVATRLLENVRGPARARIVDLFERRGVADEAIDDTRSRIPATRARAAEVLGLLRTRAGVPELRRLLRDRDRDVRQVATRALGRIGEPSAVLPLMETLSAARPVPKHIVAQAVLRLGPSALPALAAAADHTDADVREVAIETLGMAGGHDAAPTIITALRSDDVAIVRVRAAGALGTLGLPSAEGPLLEATGDRDPAVREAAVQALAELGAPAVPRIRELLEDPAYTVARASARSLLELGPRGREALEDAAGRGGSAELIADEALAAASLGSQEGGR